MGNWKLFLILVLVLSAVGCAQQEEPINQESTFQASILEIGDGYFLVEPQEGSPEKQSADQILVPSEPMDSALAPEVGDLIVITYNGVILESYPGQLSEVYRIEVVE